MHCPGSEVFDSVRRTLLLCLFLLVLEVVPVDGFYLPGVAPRDFERRESVTIKVNKLTSTKTQLPYDYYSLPYCRPNTMRVYSENLGEKLRGDKIENSPYVIQMRYNQECKFLCRIEALSEEQVRSFQTRIDDGYRVTMILDNLPLAMVMTRHDGLKPIKLYTRGFPIGYKVHEKKDTTSYLLNNHLQFTVLFNKNKETDLARIVGFEVQPFSVNHSYEGDWKVVKNEVPILSTCHRGDDPVFVSDKSPTFELKPGKEVIFTYGVNFEESEIPWSSRWDAYLMIADDQIHWFSIVNSVMIVFCLSGMVAMILLRTLHKDIAAYNEMQTTEEAIEETGWKLIYGDVFRPPIHPSLLAAYIGVGVQLLGMTIVTMIFAVLGFLSPANRGALMTAMLFFFVFMGYFAGYYSAALYRSFKGTNRRKNIALTAFMFPGVVFGIFFVLNTLLWRESSTGAVPFGTLFALCFLWFGISVPLVLIGSNHGLKANAFEFPVRTNKIPRQVPEQPWYMRSTFSILIGGILPFGAVFIEVFFILSSLWLHQFYYLFGFLFLVFCILSVTCAEISMVLCYFQLCSEDYRWWWRAYFTSGSSAGYLFIYSIYYYTKLDIHGFVSTMLYFGYMSIITYGFFCLTGTIGFLATFWFVKRIYSAVKFD
eukprot:g473.t1